MKQLLLFILVSTMFVFAGHYDTYHRCRGNRCHQTTYGSNGYIGNTNSYIVGNSVYINSYDNKGGYSHSRTHYNKNGSHTTYSTYTDGKTTINCTKHTNKYGQTTVNCYER